MDVARSIMEANGVTTTTIRVVDHDVAPGVYPDMTAHGWVRDDWPAIQQQVMAADILILGTPIWLGEKSSVCTRVIDAPVRLFGGAQRSRPICLLWPNRRLHSDR